MAARCAEEAAERPDAASEQTPTETRQKDLARFFVDNFVQDGMTLGIGSGPTVSAIIEEVGRRVTDGKLQGIKCVAGGVLSASECAFQGLEAAFLSDQPEVDLAVEEAVQVDIKEPSMPYLTWAASTQHNKASYPMLSKLRNVMRLAKVKVVVADTVRKAQDGRLEGELPVMIEVGEDDEAWEETAEELDDVFLGDADLWRRPSSPSDMDDADPRGGKTPYVSKEGNTIVDIRFYGAIRMFGEEKPYVEIAKEIESVPGVLAHGLMLDMADFLLLPDSKGQGIVTLAKTDNIQLSGEAVGDDS